MTRKHVLRFDVFIGKLISNKEFKSNSTADLLAREPLASSGNPCVIAKSKKGTPPQERLLNTPLRRLATTTNPAKPARKTVEGSGIATNAKSFAKPSDPPATYEYVSLYCVPSPKICRIDPSEAFSKSPWMTLIDRLFTSRMSPTELAEERAVKSTNNIDPGSPSSPGSSSAPRNTGLAPAPKGPPPAKTGGLRRWHRA